MKSALEFLSGHQKFLHGKTGFVPALRHCKRSLTRIKVNRQRKVPLVRIVEPFKTEGPLPDKILSSLAMPKVPETEDRPGRVSIGIDDFVSKDNLCGKQSWRQTVSSVRSAA